MSADSVESFATLTHARLRASQGDIAGAARILRDILEIQPDHAGARELLVQIEHHVDVVRKVAEEDAPAPVSPATAGDLRLQFRGALSGRVEDLAVGRLSHWLERVKRNRGDRHVR